MKDYHATLTLRNGRMKRAMDDLGLTGGELARRANCNPTIVSAFLTMKANAFIEKKKRYKEAAIRIAEALATTPQYLFPNHMGPTFIATNKIEGYADASQIRGICPHDAVDSDPFLLLAGKEFEHSMTDAFMSLDQRERAVISMAFGLVEENQRTDVEISEICDVCTATVAGTKARALKKMNRLLTKHGFSIKDAIVETAQE